MESRNESHQDQEGLAGAVMEGLEGPKETLENENSHGSMGHDTTNDPLYVQKRLKQQKRAHEREMRDMQARIADLQAQVLVNQPSNDQATNPYAGQPGSIDESIHKAVSYALQQKELAERKAMEQQAKAHIANQYQGLQQHLDKMSDKYDDFDDVVRSPQGGFTPAMRDFSMTLPKEGAGSAGEVLYKLGKNPEELSRIAKLHPLDQAQEMMKLSHALISGGGEPKASQQSSRPLGQIKNNPVIDSHVTTDKTPIGNIRQRMKSGTWK